MLLLETFNAVTALPWYAIALLLLAGAGVFYGLRIHAAKKKTGPSTHGQLKLLGAGLTIMFSLFSAGYAFFSWTWLSAVVVDQKGITLPGLQLGWEDIENARLVPGAEDGSTTLSITHHQNEVYILPGNIYPTTAIFKAMQAQSPSKDH